MINISKTLVEVILVIATLLLTVASGAFYYSTLRAKLEISNIQLRVSAEQLEFARKVQQNIDSNRVEVGVLKSEVRDIKGILKKWNKDVRDRAEFPPENIPPHTDF